MTIVQGLMISEVLKDALCLSECLREMKEARARSRVLDPEKEEKKQREFERSIAQFGVFPHGKGFRIA